MDRGGGGRGRRETEGGEEEAEGSEGVSKDNRR